MIFMDLVEVSFFKLPKVKLGPMFVRRTQKNHVGCGTNHLGFACHSPGSMECQAPWIRQGAISMQMGSSLGIREITQTFDVNVFYLYFSRGYLAFFEICHGFLFRVCNIITHVFKEESSSYSFTLVIFMGQMVKQKQSEELSKIYPKKTSRPN